MSERKPELFDVIDPTQAEALIAQHDRYSYRGFDIQKRDDRERLDRWFIYHNATEVHFKFERRDPVSYETLAEALNECSLANMEKWGLTERKDA